MIQNTTIYAPGKSRSMIVSRPTCVWYHDIILASVQHVHEILNNRLYIDEAV